MGQMAPSYLASAGSFPLKMLTLESTNECWESTGRDTAGVLPPTKDGLDVGNISRIPRKRRRYSCCFESCSAGRSEERNHTFTTNSKEVQKSTRNCLRHPSILTSRQRGSKGVVDLFHSGDDIRRGEETVAVRTIRDSG